MAHGSKADRPLITRRIEQLTRDCRRARRVRNWIKFGLATFAVTSLATFLLSLVSPDSPLAVTIFVMYAATELAAFVVWIIAPLRRRITVEQVALFVDEQHPEYENRVASAVEFANREDEGASKWIVARFLEETEPMVRESIVSDVFDASSARPLAFSALFLMLLSGALMIGFKGVWFPGVAPLLPGDSAKYVPLPFTVEPGNMRVRRGDSQMIWVHSDSPNNKVLLKWRIGESEWQGLEMDRSNTEDVHYYQFDDIQADIEYQVQLANRRSDVFELTAWTPPEVDSINVTYNYPEYLAMASREVPNTGNITAVEGTKVDLAVWVNKKLASAELVLDSGSRIPLSQSAETLWTTQITLSKDDAYHVELVDEDKAPSEYNHAYKITVQRDKPPEIRIEFPRGDSEVTFLDEIPFDFKVNDDFGFAQYGIQYEIAGKEPVKIPLHADKTDSALVMEANGHHEIMLENLELEVGDFITWTVWAEDSKPDRAEYADLGDPYFLEIRPFRRSYQEAVSMGGAGGMGGGGQNDQEPAGIQKQIIIATWNLRREAPDLEDADFETRLATIVETQEDLKSKVNENQGLGGEVRPEMIRLRQAMEQAIDALKGAQMPKPEASLSEATVAEQQAYRMILKMTPDTARVQQQQNQQGGGGGGGGGEERPDVQALELARNRNFYEEENVTQEQQQAADEVLNKIKELAQRQQIINQEIAKLISEMTKAQTEQEREEIRRRLERLQEEQRQNLERVDEVQQHLASEQMNQDQARQAREALQEARRDMNRSLDEMQEDRLQQARTSGSRAMDSLDEIQEYLQQFTRTAAAQRMQELLDNMNELTEKQEGVSELAKDIQEKHNAPSLSNQNEVEAGREQMMKDKDALANEFVEMMDQASDLAERAQQSQELMSRELGDWLRETAKEGILEDIKDTQRLVQHGIWDNAVMAEEIISQKFEEAKKNLEQVAQSLVQDELEGMQKALEHLDELMKQNPAGQKMASAQGEKTENPDGNAQGEKPGETREPAPSENGEQPGQQPGEQGAEGQSESTSEKPGSGQGQQPSESESQQPGQQPGQQQGSGQGGQSQGEQPQGGQEQQGGAQAGGGENQDGQQRQLGNPNQRGQADGRVPERSGIGASGPGGWSAPLGPLDMRRFAEDDYQNWLEQLRAAESLLDNNSPFRNQIGRIREEIEGIRRQWREREMAPKFDLFLNAVAQPLATTAEQLQLEIQRQLNEKEFVLVDEGDVPERYKDQVAEYFKNLSESEVRN